MDDKETAWREKRIKSAERLLGSPVLLDSSEELSKTRLRLLVTAALALAVGYFNLHIGDNASFLGLKILGLTDGVVRTSLFAIVSYVLIHFTWGTWDGLVEWRLRLTGINETIITDGIAGSKEVEDSRSARQLTLYSWWLRQANNMGDIGATLKEVQLSLKKLDATSAVLAKAPNPRAAAAAIGPELADIHATLKRLLHELPKASSITDSAHVVVSLRRFNHWFLLLLISQNLRWLMFEFVIPFFLGLSALVALTWSLWPLL